MKSEIIIVKSVIEAGFSYGYLLCIPEGMTQETVLVAEMNNTGKPTNDNQEIFTLAQDYLINSTTANLIRELKLPYLITLFPRYPDLYTHYLSRETLLSQRECLKRIDIQFIKIIEHAKSILKEKGFKVENKIILNGFSASGAFSNRFAMMYPELLKCVISGGQTYAMIPLKEYNGLKLTYPIGIYDLHEITGIEFNEEIYFKLPQFIYEGDQNNDNDTTKYSECMTKEQAAILFNLFGNLPKSKRLKNQITLFKELGYSNIIMKVYEGEGHHPQIQDLKEFIKANIDYSKDEDIEQTINKI